MPICTREAWQPGCYASGTDSHPTKGKEVGRRKKSMKRTLTAVAAVSLLSFGTAWAAETPKPEAAKPAAEAPAAAQAAPATTAPHKKSTHHHKAHATAKKTGDGSVAPAPNGDPKPATPHR